MRILALCLLATFELSCAELGIDPAIVDQVLGEAGTTGPSVETVVAGLRQALEVGTERAVASTSKRGGFLDDPLLRIAFPEELDGMAKGLRAVGMGARVDQLEVSMNRAAEAASAEAEAVFRDAIRSMTISDAMGILNGGDDAATRYFRGRTEGTLRERFSPVVDFAMKQVGLVRLCDELVGQLHLLALFRSPTVELNRYVTDQTLDGLFPVLAREEKRIREAPVARSTDLPRRVFGRRQRAVFGRRSQTGRVRPHEAIALILGTGVASVVAREATFCRTGVVASEGRARPGSLPLRTAAHASFWSRPGCVGRGPPHTRRPEGPGGASGSLPCLPKSVSPGMDRQRVLTSGISSRRSSPPACPTASSVAPRALALWVTVESVQRRLSGLRPSPCR